MTRQFAIDSLGYGMFANNSELVHDIFNHFENDIKTLNVAIKIYEGALKASSEKQAELSKRITQLQNKEIR